MKTSAISLAAVLCLAGSAVASTFTVNNVVDPGNGTCDTGCTLREAIAAANANPGADDIVFNIPGTGVHTITLIADLPLIIGPVTIDGYTQQPGASANTLAVGNNAVLQIEVNGDNAFDGFLLAANDCTLRGLVINRCDGNGIFIAGLFGSIVSNTLIEGNFIGTDPGGTIALGNGSAGVVISGGTNNVIGGITPAARNLISGNIASGVALEDGASENVVQGNYIGTDATGTVALGNHANGVSIKNSANNVVGGAEVGARNVISANGVIFAHGIEINGNTASGNQVLGNFIGTDSLGTADLGNNQSGVLIIYAPDNIIGGATAGSGNVISGNAFGIQISATEAIGTQVQGNRIGTDPTGSLPLANSNSGILLFNGATDTTIGGPGSAGNVIAFNEGAGVILNSIIPSTENHIFGNSIFSNEGLGIDLAGGTGVSDGVTANDLGDADTGENNLQNYPVINEIAVAGANRTVEGQLNSAANTDYVLDFYRNSEVDPSGFGEGETYLGSLDVHTSALGEVFFSFPLEADAAGQFITATATDPEGNTSEFSMASEAVPAIGRFLNVSTRLRVQTGENVLIGGFIITGTAPAEVLLRAIGPSLGDFGVEDFLANPTLELHFSDGTVVTNNNWRDTQEAEIIATGIPPNDDAESAILVNLEPGAYTAIVSGVNGGTGIGLVEAYDLSATDAERFANVSTRGLVETEDNVMIGGVIVGTNTGMMARVVVRAIGPSLADAGVSGALQDPRLELFDGNGMMIQANDNWKDSQQAEIEATGLAPGDDRESAIVRDLAPGAYTAITRGVGDTTGVGLVEAYDIQ